MRPRFVAVLAPLSLACCVPGLDARNLTAEIPREIDWLALTVTASGTVLASAPLFDHEDGVPILRVLPFEARVPGAGVELHGFRGATLESIGAPVAHTLESSVVSPATEQHAQLPPSDWSWRGRLTDDGIEGAPSGDVSPLTSTWCQLLDPCRVAPFRARALPQEALMGRVRVGVVLAPDHALLATATGELVEVDARGGRVEVVSTSTLAFTDVYRSAAGEVWLAASRSSKLWRWDRSSGLIPATDFGAAAGGVLLSGARGDAPFEIDALIDGRWLTRFDGARWSPHLRLAGTSAAESLLWLEPGVTLVAVPEDYVVLRVEGTAQIPHLLKSKPRYLTWIDGFGALLGVYPLGLLRLVQGQWAPLRRSPEETLDPLRRIARFGEGLVFGGVEGRLGAYQPNYGVCAASRWLVSDAKVHVLLWLGSSLLVTQEGEAAHLVDLDPPPSPRCFAYRE
ncbi:MAG: hypothetical protein IT384_22080 [Deltaproteobacteria bacterium]|nr:hypothetical protein [Deltaproteobacteria bacterium]